jgi:hypothetical protein
MERAESQQTTLLALGQKLLLVIASNYLTTAFCE